MSPCRVLTERGLFFSPVSSRGVSGPSRAPTQTLGASSVFLKRPLNGARRRLEKTFLPQGCLALSSFLQREPRRSQSSTESRRA